MTLRLDKIEYREIILDGCKCGISVYEGKSYIIISGEIQMSLVKVGPVSDEYILETILDRRKEDLKEVMKIAEKIPW